MIWRTSSVGSEEKDIIEEEERRAEGWKGKRWQIQGAVDD